MMNAIAPQPNGIMGCIHGIATSSLAVGGLAVGGESMDVTKARIIVRATKNMQNKHTQRDTSP